MAISKSILFLVESTFNKRDYERFGIQLLNDRDYCVEVWDLTPVLSPSFYKRYTPPDLYTFDGYKSISDKKSFIECLNRLKGNLIVVCMLGYGIKYDFIYRYLSKRNLRYGYQLLGMIPLSISIIDKKRKYQGLINIVLKAYKDFNTFLFKIIDVLYKKLPMDVLKINPPGFIIVGGMASEKDQRYPVTSSTDVIHAHSYDYDLFLKTKDKQIVNQFGSYAVFLDEFIPFEPDAIHSNREYHCSKDDYYPSVNNFFKYLVDKLGIKIIIAAHPRSNYNKHPDYFEGSRTIRGKTIHLVKNANFVIAHASTALSFAVLYNKPVIFLTHDLYSKKYQKDIELSAAALGKSAINLSRDYPKDVEDELVVNKNIYSKYMINYIKKPDTPEKPIWKIFADYCDTRLIDWEVNDST